MLKMLYTEFYMFKKLNTYLDYIEDTQIELQEMKTTTFEMKNALDKDF